MLIFEYLVATAGSRQNLVDVIGRSVDLREEESEPRQREMTGIVHIGGRVLAMRRRSTKTATFLSPFPSRGF
ncbi:hypothetical protein Tcan_13545 [Toxocara canis]|uniref:Uncharacterized protein n=1 Tax=Toxocara canis TaxID=6265 RepID=A0A0B2VBY5_TOXCA|nr:hypothetical protein Tcan_13545 [Toxocara canis]